MLNITFLNHSGFLVETKNNYFIFDYYTGELPILDVRKSVYVFSSHSHFDHYNKKIFHRIKEQGFPDDQISAVLSSDIQKLTPPRVKCIYVEPDGTYALSAGIVLKTLSSTDEGVAFLLSADNKMIYHAGDLNDWVWEGESEEYNTSMTKNYRSEIDKLRNIRIDIAMVPLDPRQDIHYSRGILYFLKETKAEKIIPMHYWEKPEIIHKFLSEYPQYLDKVVNTEELKTTYSF